MLSEEVVRNFIEKIIDAESSQMKIVRERVEELGLIHEEVFPSQTAFFRALCLGIDVKEILEIGTFLGYSTTSFAEILRDSVPDGQITSIERDPQRILEAKRLLQDAGLDQFVMLMMGDAQKVCQELLAKGRVFDLIFLDTFEGEYPEIYPLCVELLKPRGMLVVDNVLMATVDGWTAGKNVIEASSEPVHAALIKLLHMAVSDKRMVSSILPLGSGLLICTKKPDI